MSNRTEQLAAAIAAALPTWKPRVWERHGKSRIYLNTKRRDTKAFIEVDPDETDSDIYAGCALRVYVDSPNTKWACSEAKQIKYGFMLEIQEAAEDGEIESELLSQPICDHWRQVVL